MDLATPTRFELVPAATLIGWIRPVTPGVEVHVWHQAASGPRFWTEYRPPVDASGRFELGDLTPGQYLASSWTPDGTNAREAGILLDPGETRTVTLAASGGAEIRGRVTRRGAGNTVPGAVLRFESRDDLPRVLRDAGQRSVVSGADGRYVTQAMTPGKYRVEVEAEGLSEPSPSRACPRASSSWMPAPTSGNASRAIRKRSTCRLTRQSCSTSRHAIAASASRSPAW